MYCTADEERPSQFDTVPLTGLCVLTHAYAKQVKAESKQTHACVTRAGAHALTGEAQAVLASRATRLRMGPVA